MPKDKKSNKYCNCQTFSEKKILNPEVRYSFCEKCGCVLLKASDGSIYYTLKPKQKRLPFELSPISLVKHMKKKTEESYPYIYDEFNVDKNDKNKKEKAMESINIYLKYRKTILSKLQQLMKSFDYCDNVFYQTVFYLDNYFSHIITEEMTEKIILYYLIGYFLCSAKFKETDIYEPSLDSFFNLSKGIYLSMDKIAYYEILCLKTIDYNVFSYSAYDWISQLISNGIVFNCEMNNSTEVILIKGHRHSLINTINKYAIKLLMDFTFKNIFFKYSPMYIAISLIQIAREKYLDQNMINRKLFFDLINLYGVKSDDYKKCYEEIKSEIKEINEESDNKSKEKENDIKVISDEHLPDLRGHKRNESTNKAVIKGKNIYVPNKLKSSNALIHVKDDLTDKNSEDHNKESLKEKEKENKGNEIELSLNEIIPKKKFKIKSQKDVIKAINPSEKLIINMDSKENNDIPPKEFNISQKVSIIKKKKKLKELTHVKFSEIKNSPINTSHAIGKEKDNEKSNSKSEYKFNSKSNKNIYKLNNIETRGKNGLTSIKISALSEIENKHTERIKTIANDEPNLNQNIMRNKKHYKFKKQTNNIKVRFMTDEETKID